MRSSVEWRFGCEYMSRRCLCWISVQWLDCWWGWPSKGIPIVCFTYDNWGLNEVITYLHWNTPFSMSMLGASFCLTVKNQSFISFCFIVWDWVISLTVVAVGRWITNLSPLSDFISLEYIFSVLSYFNMASFHCFGGGCYFTSSSNN